jgi:glucose repression regulatory protein TUP1
MLCSGSLDCSIRIWDLSVPPPARPAGAPAPKAESLPNGEAGSGFGACQTVLKGHKDYVLSVGVTNDGRWVVSGSKDRGVQFYDTKSKAVQLLLQGHKNSGASPVLVTRRPCTDRHA